MEKGRRCEICIFDVYRVSYAKHSRSERHLEIIRQVDIIIPKWFFKEKQTPFRKKK